MNHVKATKTDDGNNKSSKPDFNPMRPEGTNKDIKVRIKQFIILLNPHKPKRCTKELHNKVQPNRTHMYLPKSYVDIIPCNLASPRILRKNN